MKINIKKIVAGVILYLATVILISAGMWHADGYIDSPWIVFVGVNLGIIILGAFALLAIKCIKVLTS